MSRRREVALAGHLGDEETAQGGLIDPSPAVRATALGALARMDRLGIDQLHTALSDPAGEVRARAAELAAGFTHEGRRLLVSALSDPDGRVVEAACFTLGEMGASDGRDGGAGGAGQAADVTAADVTAAVMDLGEVSRRHRDPLCREAAVAALGAIGDERGLAAILAATSDKPAVRRRAVLALAPFEGLEVDAALDRALSDRDWQVRQAAEDLTS